MGTDSTLNKSQINTVKTTTATAAATTTSTIKPHIKNTDKAFC